MSPLTPRRRKAAILAAAAATLSGSSSLLHHSHPTDWTDITFGVIVGISIGAMIASALVLVIKDRRACS